MNMYDAYAVVTSSSFCVEGDVELMEAEKKKKKTTGRTKLSPGTSLSAARTSLSGVPHGYGGRL
jgi:hypothetical protein